MGGPVSPEEPKPSGGPLQDWPHHSLYERVIDALHGLPESFRTSLNIAGIRVTDLHTLNSALGASIEQSVVDNLNALRAIWDPEDRYQLYGFVRQSQGFPDVVLQTAAPNIDPKIIMGIELKGWFALAGEGEPSFRYRVNPNVCAPADLLAVFPWILDEVISGKPRLMTPFIVEAHYAALHRNYYWTRMRGAAGDQARIIPAQHQDPYPRRRQRFLDTAVRDPGHNFGRIARGLIMDSFIRELNNRPVAGIALGAWQRFFNTITEITSETVIRERLAAIARTFGGQTEHSEETAQRLDRLLAALADFGFGEKPK